MYCGQMSSNLSHFVVIGECMRKPSERQNDECMVPIFTHGGVSIMLWWCLWVGKDGDLIEVNGTMKE